MIIKNNKKNTENLRNMTHNKIIMFNIFLCSDLLNSANVSLLLSTISVVKTKN